MSIGLTGKLKSVAVKDFVTYNESIFFVGENLNLIIGPNGTGKSTLVSAIVLGMGGNCKLLSRSSNISDYVKNGKETAQIEVTIYKNEDGDVITFNRSFNTEERDLFSVDGKSVNHKNYLKAVKKFNIQVENLCQFLPQDRVQDFARMNPQEILKNTQSSVCEPEMADILANLIELRVQQKTVDKRNNEVVNQLNENEKRNETIKPQLENMRLRNVFVEDIDDCNRKRAWLEVEELTKKCQDVKNDIANMEIIHEGHKKKLAPIHKQAEEIKKFQKEFEEKLQQENKGKTASQAMMNKQEDLLEQLNNDLKKNRSDLQEIISGAKERESQIKQLKLVLSALSVDLKNGMLAIGNMEHFKINLNLINSKIQVMKNDSSKFVTQREEIQHELEENIRPKMIAIERRITTMENITQKRLEFLKVNHEETYRAVCWLRENREMFKGHVYDPIILEINIKDISNAKYIENTVSIRDLIAFTCERKDDMALFLRETRTKQRLQVNAVQSNPIDYIRYQSQVPINQLKNYGFHSYLIDMIEGPPPILNYLCQLNHIHNIPVGNDHTYDVASSVPDDIRLFFTSQHRFAVSISRYSNAKSTKSSEISSRNFLISVDQDLLNKQKEMRQSLVRQSDQLRNERTKIEDQINFIQIECNKLAATKRTEDEKMQHLKVLKEKLLRQEQKVKALQENVVNIDEEKMKTKQKNQLIIGKMFSYIKTYNEHLKINVETSNVTQLHRLIQKRYNHENRDIASQIRLLEDEINRSGSLVQRIKNALEIDIEKVKKKELEAKELTNGYARTHKKFLYTEKFNKLPDTLIDLQIHMDEIQTRIDCMGLNNATLQTEFENREKLIEELRAKIANTQDSFETIENKIIDLHNRWYPEMNRVVTQINQNFTRYMSSMGYAGEVELCAGATERDYADYGIQIRVKYRNTGKLQILDRQVQSGGERAVAIAVYTLSLQHLTHVPFRCVDEINQGMDPKNERKIFEMLVKETCKVGESQYFFVTPKLLPNFKDHDLMDVIVIYNGPHIDGYHMFQLDKLGNDADEEESESDD